MGKCIRSVGHLNYHGESECDPLVDIENCRELGHCPYDKGVAKYSWKSGDWTSCRKVSVRLIVNELL